MMSIKPTKTIVILALLTAIMIQFTLSAQAQRLSVGETRQYAVSANQTHNFPHLLVKTGEKYTLTASFNDKWQNGQIASGPNGYTPTTADAFRRHAEFNQMALVGEIFKGDNIAEYSGRFFKVGTSACFTAPVEGYFCFFANDILTGYWDNSGSITVSIKRVDPSTLTTPGELAVGQSKTVAIHANERYNLTGIFMCNGQRFQFSTSSPAWYNGNRWTDCNGFPGVGLERHGEMKEMALIGELFEQNNKNHYTGTYFGIGCSNTLTVTNSGYLICFANDIFTGYGDNSGIVNLTVKRIQ